MPVGSQNVRVEWTEQVRRLAHAALDLLFPPRCVVCKRPGVLLCARCIAAFEPVIGPLCPVCGEPQSSTSLCSPCTSHPRAFQSVESAYLFTGGVRQAIHSLKYERRTELATPLAEAMSTALHPPSNSAQLCAVPLHPTRLAQRGYNQSALLAQGLAAVWGDNGILPVQALYRTRDTQTQVGLKYDERRLNVGDAFCADPALVAGQTIVLIDDVCTTGATLDECARALLDAGAVSVRAMTLARAV